MKMSEQFKMWYLRWADTDKIQEPDSAYESGWIDCKKAILEILRHNWQGADLSPNSCDQYYIDRIEKEI
jgi:hypothetical protein